MLGLISVEAVIYNVLILFILHKTLPLWVTESVIQKLVDEFFS